MKRKITPSAEQSPSKKVVVIVSPSRIPTEVAETRQLCTSPYIVSKMLFPQDTAQITHEYTVSPTPATALAPTTTAIETTGTTRVAARDAPWNRGRAMSATSDTPWSINTRHILLPWDLRDTNIDVLDGEVYDTLMNIFPGTNGFFEGRNRSYLSFDVMKRPAAPWPLTIGGLPITIGDDEQGRGPLFPRLNRGNLRMEICQDIDAREEDFSAKSLRALAPEVMKQLPHIARMNFVELIFTTDCSFYVVLSDQFPAEYKLTGLPGMIANCVSGYILEKELCRPLWLDRQPGRYVEPDPIVGIVDTTPYDTIRPGVMLCSRQTRNHAHPATLSTTCGVMVSNSANDLFITAASHGIGEDDIVYQPLPAGRRVLGKAVQEVSFTDVAMVQLEQDVQFVNQTFENTSGVTPEFSRLFGEHPGDELKPLRTHRVYLNSSFAGDMEGSIVAKSIKLARTEHPTDQAHRYVVYDWAYTGQIEGAGENRVVPPDGTCGSAIWDDHGVILGFFHYHITSGRFAGFMGAVSADEVVRAGYKLAGMSNVECDSQ